MKKLKRNNELKNMKTMRVNNLFALLITGMILMYGCGKPQEAESLVPDDISGGFTIKKKFPTSAYAQDVIKKDNLLYIAQGEGGLTIIDVQDPLNPQTVSVVSEGVRGYSTRIAMKDTVVYLASGSFGVNVINVSNPEAPVVTVSNLNMKPARNLLVKGNYMFTAISEQGVRISEISYPTYPDIRGGMSTNGYAHGLDISQDTAYLFVACGEMGLSLFDITNFQEGFGNYRVVGWGDTPGYAEAVEIDDDNSLAYMACGTAGLQIVDYSDTNNVVIVGSYDGPGYAKSLVYKDHMVYMAAEKGGLQIIDVSNISNPRLIGLVETEYALGLTVDEPYIYVTDETDGLVVVSFPEVVSLP
jgi:hypothetical protein